MSFKVKNFILTDYNRHPDSHIKGAEHLRIVYFTFFLDNLEYFWHRPAASFDFKTFPFRKNFCQFFIIRAAGNMRDAFRLKLLKDRQNFFSINSRWYHKLLGPFFLQAALKNVSR